MFVAVVEQTVPSQLGDRVRGQVEAGHEVLVVVLGHRQEGETAASGSASHGHNVRAGQRHVLGVGRTREGALLRCGGGHVEGDPHGLVRGAHDLRAHQPGRPRDLLRRLRMQVEQGGEEQDGLVVVLPRLGEVHVVHAGDQGVRRRLGRVRAELLQPRGHPAVPVGTEEDLGRIRGEHPVQHGFVRLLGARDHRGE